MGASTNYGELAEGEAAVGGEGGGVGGEGAIPDFGGGEADVGEPEPEEVAETDVEIEEPVV